jgi:hypothetical protein
MAGSESAYKYEPHLVAAVLTYYAALFFGVAVLNTFFIWSWIVLFLPPLVSWRMRQPIPALANRGGAEQAMIRAFPKCDGVRFSGLGAVFHHAVIFIAAAVLAGALRAADGYMDNSAQGIFLFYDLHLAHWFSPVTNLVDSIMPFRLVADWPVFALIGFLQSLVFWVFSLTPRCIDPWAGRVLPKQNFEAPVPVRGL